MAKVRIQKNDPVKKRLINYLGDNYRDSDEETIDLYCETYRFYQQMRSELSEGRIMMEYTNKAGATNLVKNPLVIELTKITQMLNNLLKSLGLTPAQRKDIDTDAGLDDFEKF